MAHVRKRDGRFQSRWIGADGKEHGKTFDTRREAERHGRKMETAKDDGVYVDLGNKLTVTQYAREQVATRPHRATTAVRVKSVIDVHLDGSRLGGMHLSAVRPDHVQGWVTELSRKRKLSPSSVKLAMAVLRSVFNAAVRNRLLVHSPAAGVTLPRTAKGKIVPRTVAEVAALADAVPERCHAMILVHAQLGLRLGELLGLQVADINRDFRTVRIERQLTQDG